LLRERPRPFVYALLVHLALLGVLVLSLDWAPSVKPGAAGKKAPVQAVIVDAAKLESEVRRRKQQEDEKRRAAEAQQKKIEQKAKAAELKRKKEEKRVADLKRKKAEKKKALAENKRKAEARKKAEAERKRKAAKQKAVAERKRKVEAKKKAEAERKRKAEARKKAEAERKRKQEEAKRKAVEQEMQARLAAEQERMAAQRRSAMQRVIDEYVLYIQQKVERSWIRPPDSGSELSCTVEVRLIPGGDVIDARIVRSSGNPVFDRSVEAAVFKASPLPVPGDVEVMEKFRTIRFEFKPG